MKIPVVDMKRQEPESRNDLVAAPPNKKCHVLKKLPAELHNQIYELAMADHISIYQPSLLRTCRQIRNEALSLFYSTHEFEFTFKCQENLPWSLLDWTRSIGEERAYLVNKVSFDVMAEWRGHWVNPRYITLRCTRNDSRMETPEHTWRSDAAGAGLQRSGYYEFVSWKELDMLYQFDAPLGRFLR